MCTGGPPKSADPLRIDVVRRGVGAHPTHGALDVVELGWPWVGAVAWRKEPVVDVEGDVPRPGERCGVRAHVSFAAFTPAAAVDQDDRGKQRFHSGGDVSVENQIDAFD